MGLVERGVIFMIGTISNAILFLFTSRVILEIVSVGESVAGTGPATPAMNLLAPVMQLVIGMIQLGLIAYLIAGIGEQKSVAQEPMP